MTFQCLEFSAMDFVHLADVVDFADDADFPDVLDFVDFADFADSVYFADFADLADVPIHPANVDKSEVGGLQNTSFSTISGSTAVGAVFLRSGAF